MGWGRNEYHIQPPSSPLTQDQCGSFTGLITAPCGHLPVTRRIWALENSHKAILVSPLLLSTISLIKDSSVTFLWLINVSGD